MAGRLHRDRKPCGWRRRNAVLGGSLIWTTAVFFCIIILISLYAVVRKRASGAAASILAFSDRGDVSARDSLDMSSEAKVIGSRTNTFIFFGVAMSSADGWPEGS